MPHTASCTICHGEDDQCWNALTARQRVALIAEQTRVANLIATRRAAARKAVAA